MSDSDNSAFAGFGKFVPGFDFLQNLATQAAGSAAQKIPQLPNLGGWVAPTLNVEELDKRIDELKAVQFWLDQNAMALKATIQALEVQKMTLATLKGMNLSMGDVANAFKLKVSDSLAGGMQKAAEKAKTFSGFEIPPSIFKADQARAGRDAGNDDQAAEADASDDEQAPETAPARSASGAQPAGKSSKAAKPASAGGVVDPMQWWGALTQQFQTIAGDAMKEAAKKAALETGKSMATDMAKNAMKTASSVASGLAKEMAGNAGKAAADGTRTAMNSALRSNQAWPVPAGKTPAAAGRAKAAPARKAAAKSAAKPGARAPAKSALKTARKTLR